MLNKVIAILAVGAFAGSLSQAGSGNIISVTNGNSSISVDLTSPRGMYEWQVDGKNYLFQQWFWYRLGPTNSEVSIETIGSPVAEVLGGRLLTVRYTNDTLAVEVGYLLTGGSPRLW